MKKRIFIIHGWCGYPEEGWFPWLKKELDKRGFAAEILKMPNAAAPKLEEWIAFLKNAVGKIDESTFFIGHSIGAQTILRYLETLEEKERVGGAVFVAGWFTLSDWPGITAEDKKIAKPWLEMPINCDKVKRRVKKIVAIFSDNDNAVPLKNKDFFKERLDAEVIIDHQKGHFRGEDNITELPSVLEALLKIANY